MDSVLLSASCHYLHPADFLALLPKKGLNGSGPGLRFSGDASALGRGSGCHEVTGLAGPGHGLLAPPGPQRPPGTERGSGSPDPLAAFQTYCSTAHIRAFPPPPPRAAPSVGNFAVFSLVSNILTKHHLPRSLAPPVTAPGHLPVTCHLSRPSLWSPRPSTVPEPLWKADKRLPAEGRTFGCTAGWTDVHEMEAHCPAHQGRAPQRGHKCPARGCIPDCGRATPSHYTVSSRSQLSRPAEFLGHVLASLHLLEDSSRTCLVCGPESSQLAAWTGLHQLPLLPRSQMSRRSFRKETATFSEVPGPGP